MRRLQADPSAVDWMGQVQPEERQRILNEILETRKSYLPTSVPEALIEIHKLAVRFEEKIYSAAISQDYRKKISLKILSMESKAHPAPSINSGMSAGAVQPQNPGDPALSIPPQVSNQPQSLINQSSMRQALLPQNLQNNTSAAVPTGRSVAMKGNSWRPAQGDPTTAAAAAAISGADPSAVDWRGQLLPEARQPIVNEIMETLKRHLLISEPEGLNELHKIAVRFEEKIYSAATSLGDYLKKICLKMLPMERNSWRPAQGDPTTAAAAAAIAGADPSAVDWRGQLLPEARQSIINEIMETLKRHLPILVPEGLNELHTIAVRFEEKIYSAATSQGDYLKKIYLKILSIESKAHPAPTINSGMSAGAVQPQNPGDPASVESTAQTGPAGGVDWQEEIYQKIISMK